MVSVLLAFLLFLFMVIKIAKISKTQDASSRLPPGPWTLPIIGNLHQIVGSLPHKALRDLSKNYGPLMHLQLGQISTIIVSSPETAKEVMKTHDAIFASRPSALAAKILTYDFADIAFAPYGKYWRQLRKICILELLSMKRVQSFRAIREEETLVLVEWIRSQAGKPVNITEKIKSLAYGITARAAFGKKYKDQDKFISNIDESTKVAAGFSIADLFPSLGFLHVISGVKATLERLHAEADRILEYIIEDHKNKKNAGNVEGAEDLVDILLKVQEHDELEFPLTSTNIKAVILDMFAGGSETSATTIDWTMVEMMKHPHIMKKAQSEVRELFDEMGFVDEANIPKLNYLKSVIEESLRLHPPIPLLLPRECRETCTINGYGIPIETRVMVNAWAINRDPEYWSDAENFIPERFSEGAIDFKGNHFEYIPFGAGRRICPGMLFGLANIEFQLAMLLYHFNWELPNEMLPGDLEMTDDFGVTMRRKADLYLVPIPYHQ